MPYLQDEITQCKQLIKKINALILTRNTSAETKYQNSLTDIKSNVAGDKDDLLELTQCLSKLTSLKSEISNNNQINPESVNGILNDCGLEITSVNKIITNIKSQNKIAAELVSISNNIQLNSISRNKVELTNDSNNLNQINTEIQKLIDEDAGKTTFLKVEQECEQLINTVTVIINEINTEVAFQGQIDSLTKKISLDISKGKNPSLQKDLEKVSELESSIKKAITSKRRLDDSTLKLELTECSNMLAEINKALTLINSSKDNNTNNKKDNK